MPDQFPSPYATLELVGRGNILSEVDSHLASADKRPQVILFTGEGGVGKTRLLNAILEKYRTYNQIRSAYRLVDLYHIQNHTSLGLVDAIVDSLTNGTTTFADTKNARAEYDKAHRSGGHARQAEALGEVLRAFCTELVALATQGRVVIALDTLERLVYTNPKWLPVETTPEYATVWEWLLKELPKWTNVTVLMAGRPAADSLVKDLEARSAIDVLSVEVRGFGADEVEAYQKAVIKAAQKHGDNFVAQRIAGLTHEELAMALYLSDGRPVYLALIIDELRNLNTGQVLRIPEDSSNRKAALQVFESAFVERLKMDQGTDGALIEMLGRLPKGADAKMLSYLLEIDADEFESRLESLKKLSFIKIRPEDDRIFLHDEMYDLLERHHYKAAVDLPVMNDVLNRLMDYYGKAFEENREKLNTIFAPIEIDSISHQIDEESIPLTGNDLNTITEAQHERRNLLTEFMYYRLLLDTDKGLKQYYRYMREAILSGDPLLDVQLQAELMQFLDKKYPKGIGLDSATAQAIVGVLTLRPIVRTFARGQYANAVRLADQARDQLVDPEDTEKTLAISLDIWGSQARIYLGGDELSIADEKLSNAIETLCKLATDPHKDEPFTNWRMNGLLALAYRVRGYLYRVQGRLTEATNDYGEALRRWHPMGFIVELATTRNDRGFAVAESGKETDGRDEVLVALSHRKWLTHRIPLALSLNTLGVISRREGAYSAAIDRSTRARLLARTLNNRRVEGLALIALAEAKRRQALSNQIPAKREKAIRLEAALTDATKAREIFAETGEQVREVEALIEIGCALRDMIRADCLGSHSKEDALERSRATFREAAELAGDDLKIKRTDALTNLAWLEFAAASYTDRVDEAILDAERSIPREISDLSSTIPARRIENHILFNVQLAKLAALKGYRALKSVHTDSSSNARLVDAISNFMASFEYNHRVNEYGHDSTRLRSEVFENLNALTVAQLTTISEYVHDHQGHPGGPEMKQFLESKVLWYPPTRPEERIS